MRIRFISIEPGCRVGSGAVRITCNKNIVFKIRRGKTALCFLRFLSFLDVLLKLPGVFRLFKVVQLILVLPGKGFPGIIRRSCGIIMPGIGFVIGHIYTVIVDGDRGRQLLTCVR